VSRKLKLAAALVGVQALVVGAWFAVQRARSQEEPPALSRSSRATRMDRPAPALALQRFDGAGARVSDFEGQPVVLHFWATWCAPCREELPGLVALAEEGAARVLAVSVDKGWGSVQRFFGGRPPAPVFLADRDLVKREFGVWQLPVTYILDARGRLRLRIDGPRRWSRDSLRSVLRDARP